MATITPIRPTLAGAEEFTINGWRPLSCLDSSIYFGQAHAVLAAALSAQEMDLNPAILAEALYGVQTLLSLGLVADENERENGRSH